MAAEIFPPFPPELTNDEFDHLITEATDWCQANGLSVRPPPALLEAERNQGNALTSHAPVTLFPSPFPRKNWNDAVKMAKVYNELYAKIVQEEDWLVGIIEELSKADDFIASLYDIHKRILAEGGYTQKASLGLFRSDYMLHVPPTNNDEKPEPQIHQVEFNTIASSFGGLSSLVTKLHSFLYATGHYGFSGDSPISVTALPENQAAQELARGLSEAHRYYGSAHSIFPKETAVLFVVQPGERNVFDQRALEYQLTDLHATVVHRVTPAALMEAYQNSQKIASTKDPKTLQALYKLPRLEIESPSNALIYKPRYARRAFEISTIYYRSMYDPSDYTDASFDLWQLRYLLEKSAAIKCPSVLTQLAGSKKIQQSLCLPGVVERFLSAPSAALIRTTFAAIYPLDRTPIGQKALSLALNPETAEKYVLKPQREGGGNNIYRSKIPPFLSSLSESSHQAYILMELIEPPSVSNVVLRNGRIERGSVINELGVYGVTLFDKNTIHENFQAGYLLRTKGRESEEGGVAAGFGAIDSVCLVGKPEADEEDPFEQGRTELASLLDDLDLGDEAEVVKSAFLKRFQQLGLAAQNLPDEDGVGRAVSLGLEKYGEEDDMYKLPEGYKIPEGEEWEEYERMGRELEGFEALGRELERKMMEVDQRMKREFGMGLNSGMEGGSVFDRKEKGGSVFDRKEEGGK